MLRHSINVSLSRHGPTESWQCYVKTGVSLNNSGKCVRFRKRWTSTDLLYNPISVIENVILIITFFLLMENKSFVLCVLDIVCTLLCLLKIA